MTKTAPAWFNIYIDSGECIGSIRVKTQVEALLVFCESVGHKNPEITKHPSFVGYNRFKIATITINGRMIQARKK